MNDSPDLTTEANPEPRREGTYLQRFLGSVVAAHSPRFTNYTWLGRWIIWETEPHQDPEQVEEADCA